MYLDVFFNFAMVKLIPRTMLTDTTMREISNEEDLNNLWTFHSRQIIVPVGSVFTISPEDLEKGHGIVTANSDGELKRNFNIVCDGNDLFMTTLGALIEWQLQ